MRRQTMTLRLAALIVLFLCMWEPSDASEWCNDDLRLLGAGWSFHAVDRKGKNETHDLIGAQCGDWSAFYFQNSQNDPAVAIGREWMPYKRGPFEGGFYAAAWFGYFPDNPVAFVPVGALRGRVNLGERFSLTVSTLAVVTAAHLEFRF